MKIQFIALLLSALCQVSTTTAQSFGCPPVLKRYPTRIVSMTGNGPIGLTRPIRDGRGNILVPEQLMVPVLFRIRNDQTSVVRNYQIEMRYSDPMSGQATFAAFSRIPPFLVDPWLAGPTLNLPGDYELRGTLLLPRSLAGNELPFTGIVTGIPGYYPPSACPQAARIDPGNKYTASISLVVVYR